MGHDNVHISSLTLSLYFIDYLKSSHTHTHTKDSAYRTIAYKAFASSVPLCSLMLHQIMHFIEEKFVFVCAKLMAQIGS